MKEALDKAQIQQFIEEGFVKLENAFSKTLAQECLKILAQDLDCELSKPETWTQPVVRLGNYSQKPFLEVANSPLLHSAYNQLAGKGRWLVPQGLGTFPIRFPHPKQPNDAGWHVDVSFCNESDNSSDFFHWRINIFSKGRALLMLFLFTDISEKDAPTRIRVGSHLDIAKKLAPLQELGLTLLELAQNNFEETAHLKEALATGEVGTVYLCHPFLVHAAQSHQGTQPRVIAQPPLLPACDFQLTRLNADYSVIEIAIRKALNM